MCKLSLGGSRYKLYIFPQTCCCQHLGPLWSQRPWTLWATGSIACLLELGNSLPITTTHYQSLPLTATHYHSLPLTATHYHSLPLTTTHYYALPLIPTHYRSLPVTTTHHHSLPFTTTPHYHWQRPRPGVFPPNPHVCIYKSSLCYYYYYYYYYYPPTPSPPPPPPQAPRVDDAWLGAAGVSLGGSILCIHQYVTPPRPPPTRAALHNHPRKRRRTRGAT